MQRNFTQVCSTISRWGFILGDYGEGRASAWSEDAAGLAVDQSVWKCTVVSDDVVRLGFCVVNGLRQEHAEQLVRERRTHGISIDRGFQVAHAIDKRGNAHLGGIRRVELFR